jgi:gas vesicle protein
MNGGPTPPFDATDFWLGVLVGVVIGAALVLILR